MIFSLILASGVGASELLIPAAAPTEPVAEPAKAQTVPAQPARLIMGDVDGDGRQDALGLAADGAITLLRNEGEAGFQDVTDASGLAAVEFATCAALVDLDADGALDLFLGSWSDRVWRNLGDGTFEPFRPGVQHGAVDLACNALDADGDGLVDLQLSTDQGDVLYRNLGAGSFAAIQLPGVSLVPGSSASNGGAAGDSRASLGVRERFARWRALTSGSAAANGAGGAAGSAMMNGPATPAGTAGSLTSTGLCAATIVDQATGQCIEASSAPALGKLYPLSTDFNIGSNGNIGIGAPANGSDIHIGGTGTVAGHRLLSFGAGDVAGLWFETGFDLPQGQNFIALATFLGRTAMSWNESGNVGIGVGTPQANLHIEKQTGSNPTMMLRGVEPIIRIDDIRPGQERQWRIRGRQAELRFTDQTASADRLVIETDGTVSVKQSLEIRGGADIVERFDSTEELEAGTVVVIDAKNPGELVASTESYDTKVAGVVSGAGGVNPGICLSQDGELDGDTLVAMNGRVYVKATAANGPIQAGDLLTTSDLAGHCMKATNHTKALGTVIGKAMSSLESGEGLVLVLVNLQ